MEFNGVIEPLKHKTILVTGSTGFLAKIYVEKVLRIQPNVKKLYLLLRAQDTASATQRVHTEVIEKEVFRLLREKHGSNLTAFVLDKVTPVAGDIMYENLGVTDPDLIQKMWKEIDVVVHFAATTNFDERYDVALNINTIGAKNILDFANKCVKIEMFIHVSTAYVCGERSGLILEKPLKMGETLNGATGLNIEEEVKLVEKRLNELKTQQVGKQKETDAMKDLGLQRARFYGWPNTYVFTKAMGEMVIGDLRGELPVVVIRPTIITSTYKEPFPGWVEGFRFDARLDTTKTSLHGPRRGDADLRAKASLLQQMIDGDQILVTIDSVALVYAKGKLTCFVGDPETIVDVIPGDIVVNAIMVAISKHSNKSFESEVIYQVGSSTRNPMSVLQMREIAYEHFSKKPLTDKNGKIIKVDKAVILTTMTKFREYVDRHYLLPLKGLRIVNFILCQYFHHIYSDNKRKIDVLLRLVELYEPYIFFKGILDDSNTETLRIAARGIEHEADTFYFDPECINWDDYFINVHFPGVVSFVLK